MKYKLKTIECVNAILKDLYVDLREKVNFWSSLTNQTPQARMGYIGQHLVSAITGYKGGKSGARGKDLIISNNEYAEIKTCTKVDQLGFCKKCKGPVSPLETSCSFCGSTNIERKDDSKWLLSITEEYPSSSALDDSEDILVNVSKPKYYYFVLFEFEDVKDSNSPIMITVYQVDSKNNGFVLCMIDYFYNIKKNAPFNMWPHMLKFNLCNPKIVYQSRVYNNSKIETLVFEPDNPVEVKFDNLQQYSLSKNLHDKIVIEHLKKEFGLEYLDFGDDKFDLKEFLNDLEEYTNELNLKNKVKISKFANGFYKDKIINANAKLKKEKKALPSVFKVYTDPLLG